MTSNPEPIVQQLQHEFQNLLAYVTGPDARSQTAYTVELTLFRRLLALGAALLRLFFVTRAAVRPAEPVTAPDGTRLTYHDQRPTTYYSVFGKVRFARHYFTAPRAGGSLPARRRVELAGALLFRPAAGVGRLWDDRRILPREPDGARTHPGAVAQPPGPRNRCHRGGGGCDDLL